jgi:hypothetical protein
MKARYIHILAGVGAVVVVLAVVGLSASKAVPGEEVACETSEDIMWVHS